jgi:DhnA family fructose-bisphosphate aldolase class Ia
VGSPKGLPIWQKLSKRLSSTKEPEVKALILGRKAFQKDMKVGADLIQSVQDVYLDKGVTIA